jgi:hypothetical protein
MFEISFDLEGSTRPSHACKLSHTERPRLWLQQLSQHHAKAPLRWAPKMGAAVKSKGFPRPLKSGHSHLQALFLLRLQRRSCAQRHPTAKLALSAPLCGARNGLALFDLSCKSYDDTLRAHGAAFTPFNGSTSPPTLVVLNPDSKRIGTVNKHPYNGEGYQRELLDRP